ncbi:MAG: ATP-binding protein [Candidatus Woesearchaeota archaeon]
MYDIVIGRNASDKAKFGKRGTILIGKQYVQMGQTTSLSNDIYMDIASAHVLFVCGKRGGGKSYTLGVIAEGLADIEPEIAQNLSIIILDTMGIYWTMKYPNKQDEDLLRQWNLEPKGLDVVIYTPVGYYKKYKEEGIPTDKPFSIKPTELSATDWCMAFSIGENSEIGVLIQRTIYNLGEDEIDYDIQTIIDTVKKDTEASDVTKQAVVNLFTNASHWGLFDKNGTPLSELAQGGQVTILDVSCYATQQGSWAIKQMAVGLVAQKLFINRMISRKDEEFKEVHKNINYFTESEDDGGKQEDPLVWLVIDEAHEFLPKDEKVASSDPLITILREGRQPGISLILATQQPGKIHTDVLTQSDTVLSHRITAKIDTDALGTLMQSYMRSGLTEYLDTLPRVKGSGVIFDDTNEKMFAMRIRPRFTWHGGSSPTAIPKKKKYFEEK